MTRDTSARLPSDRRREERHSVKLLGLLKAGPKTLPLEVGDLSFSGALILVKGGPPAGAVAELWIEDYGPITIRIMHSGAYFCGIAIQEPDAHRARLGAWLGQEEIPFQLCENRAPALSLSP